MKTPCAVFWDILDDVIPGGHSINSLVHQIRTNVIEPYLLNEIFFFCVCNVQKLPDPESYLANLDVNIIQAYSGKNSEYCKMSSLMQKFAQSFTNKCAIIVVSSRHDYSQTIIDLQRHHNISIYLVRLTQPFPFQLQYKSYLSFALTNGRIQLVDSNVRLNDVSMSSNSTRQHFPPTSFIRIRNYPEAKDLQAVMFKLNRAIFRTLNGSIDESVIFFEEAVFVGFPSLRFAVQAVGKLNGLHCHGYTLFVDLVNDSPLNEILHIFRFRELSPAKNGSHEVKKLTFIKVDNSGDSISDGKLKEFCLACSPHFGGQCVLSKKSSIWIVFAYASHAEIFLPKVKILYSDALLSKGPYLDGYCSDDPLAIEVCEHQQCRMDLPTTNPMNENSDPFKRPKKKLVNKQRRPKNKKPIYRRLWNFQLGNLGMLGDPIGNKYQRRAAEQQDANYRKKLSDSFDLYSRHFLRSVNSPPGLQSSRAH